jgi:hypothetical protein
MSTTSTITTKRRNKKTTETKRNRQLVLTVSMYLLGQESLRNLFWNVKKVTYDTQNQVVRVGINTTDGKLGTTLTKLRKVSRGLSDYLYENGLTFRQSKIIFFVDREDEQLERLMNLFEKIQSESVKSES